MNMDTYRLKVKIGPHEFEAEGPENAVKEQFVDFKKLIEGKISQAATGVVNQSTGLDSALTAPAGQIELDQLKFLFDHDPKRKEVSLRFVPQNETRLQDALLLVLYGYKRYLDLDEILVTVLKDSLQQSGLTIPRIDRIAEPLKRDGLVLKGGKGKGGKYRLTNSGIAKADTETRRLLEQVK